MNNPLNCEVAEIVPCRRFATETCCGLARCDCHMSLHRATHIDALRSEVARLKAKDVGPLDMLDEVRRWMVDVDVNGPRVGRLTVGEMAEMLALFLAGRAK